MDGVFLAELNELSPASFLKEGYSSRDVTLVRTENIINRATHTNMSLARRVELRLTVDWVWQ